MESGIDIRLLIEATLIARNRADNPRMERVGIKYDIYSSVEEEIMELLNGGYLNHLDDTTRDACVQESMSLAVGSYFYIGDIFRRTYGDLDDIDADIVCEDWLRHDIVVTFLQR